MSVRRAAGTTACILLGALLAGCLTLQAFAGYEAKEEYSDCRAVAANAAIEVSTLNGSVDVEATDTPKADLRVVKKVKGVSKEEASNYLSQIVVDIKEQPGRLSVTIRQPKGPKGVNYGADIVLKVPGQSTVTAQSTNGGVTVTGVRGAVKAATVNGGVTCTGPAAAAELRTVNGSIDGEAGAGEFSARTTNGSVIVTAPANGSFTLHAATVNGSVDNGFGIPVQGKIANKHADGTVGQGGPRVSATTVNGSVSIEPRQR